MEVRTHSRLWTTNYEVIESTERNLIGDHCSPCSACSKCLAGEEAVSQGGKQYCWKCFEKGFGFKCVSCAKPITGLSRMSFIFFNGRVWHTDCFLCSICRRSLERGQLTQSGESVYCKGCGESVQFHIG